jgi:hypothetical protein
LRITVSADGEFAINKSMKITKVLFYAMGLGLAVFAANEATAASIVADDVLTFSGTYHTQGTITNESGGFLGYKINQTPFTTKDILNALAGDLGVTNDGKASFPAGSYLMVTTGRTNGSFAYPGSATVKNHNGQSWDVSSYIQYSFASDVTLTTGIPAAVLPVGSPDPNLKFTYLAHIRFEDANHLVDLTGFATEAQNNSFDKPLPLSETVISSASGSGMINGEGALITGRATVKSEPLFFRALGNQAPGE